MVSAKPYKADSCEVMVRSGRIYASGMTRAISAGALRVHVRAEGQMRVDVRK